MALSAVRIPKLIARLSPHEGSTSASVSTSYGRLELLWLVAHETRYERVRIAAAKALEIYFGKLDVIVSDDAQEHILARIADHKINRLDELLPWRCAASAA